MTWIKQRVDVFKMERYFWVVKIKEGARKFLNMITPSMINVAFDYLD